MIRLGLTMHDVTPPRSGAVLAGAAAATENMAHEIATPIAICFIIEPT